MGMIKVIQPNAQEFSEPVASLIKISSRGLIGKDKLDFVKRAGAEFAHKLADIKFNPGEVPVHLIAIGATEDYGPNRNGDGFKRACCRDHHDTFVKRARFYRDHANKNPAKSYGVVKASAYHEPMRRIELICGLNSTKEAAERNGGLLADKEMEKLANDEPIPVSMACSIGYDVCSGCGNKARTRAEYCDSIENGGLCKSGGLKHNIGKCLEDGHVLHADNPYPSFFDISHVFRPADRIAYVSGRLEKAAAAGTTLSGAELAEIMGVGAPMDAIVGTARTVQEQFQALEKLAAAELAVKSAANTSWTKVALANYAGVCPPIPAADNIKLAEALRALVDNDVILSVRDFLDLTIKPASVKLAEAVCGALPGVFTKLLADPNVISLLEKNAYTPAYAASARAKSWASTVAHTRSIQPAAVENRAKLAALRNSSYMPSVQKTERNTDAIAQLAQHYALYKISAFAEFAKKYDSNGLTAEYCVMQNYVQ